MRGDVLHHVVVLQLSRTLLLHQTLLLGGEAISAESVRGQKTSFTLHMDVDGQSADEKALIKGYAKVAAAAFRTPTLVDLLTSCTGTVQLCANPLVNTACC